MKIVQYLLLASAVFIAHATDLCPSGGEIYEKGVDAQGQVDLLQAHNDYRKLVMEGDVPEQPKGVGLKSITYDSSLAEKARNVSETCQFERVTINDDRFYVGQNMYINYSSMPETKICPTIQNWTDAVNAWYSEHESFIYPDNKLEESVGRYTQVVWADTYLIGCDFIAFEARDSPDFPCAKLYTCNYGPGGNIKGEAPYKLA